MYIIFWLALSHDFLLYRKDFFKFFFKITIELKCNMKSNKLPWEALLTHLLHSSLADVGLVYIASDTRELIDHLHNFLRGLQNRNQMIRPSSNSAFTPVSSSSNSGFHQDQTTPQTTHETATTSTTTSTTTHEDSHGWFENLCIIILTATNEKYGSQMGWFLWKDDTYHRQEYIS